MKKTSPAKTTNKSELRKAYFLNKYVLITPERAGRPRDTKEETIIKIFKMKKKKIKNGK